MSSSCLDFSPATALFSSVATPTSVLTCGVSCIYQMLRFLEGPGLCSALTLTVFLCS